MRYSIKTVRRIIQLSIYCSLCYICISCEEDEGAESVNNPPKIEAQSFAVAENTAKDSTVGTVQATDEDGDELSFSISGGNTGEAFAIGDKSGLLTVNNPSVLDFETNPSFTLTVQVSDGTESASADIEIDIADENENLPPVIENQVFSIDELSPDGTVVGTVLASDPDGDALTFSIAGGNTGEAFAVDASSGELTVNVFSALDYETIPSFKLDIEVSDGQLTGSGEVTVNLNDVVAELFATRQDLLDALDEAYTDFGAYVEFVYLFDGVYANTTASPSTAWDDLHAHSQNSGNELVGDLWYDAYDIIFILNNIIASAENVLTDNQEKNEITGQALTIRAYLYFKLVTWFGSVPLELEIENNNASQSTQQDVVQAIQGDLTLSVDNLPVTWPADKARNVTKGFAQCLMARTYLFNEDWSNALSVANDVINNAEYDLSDNTTSFTSDNTELIWGFDQTGNAQFSGFFSKGNHVPVFRLTEAYLVAAEANTALGNLIDTKDAIDALKLRAGEAILSVGLSQNQLFEITLAQWKSEMDQEGTSFITLRRFFEAESELSISNFQLLLPIPQSLLDENPNLFQNPGY